MGTIDILIIGQGLAGSLLGLALLKQGRRVLVVDDGHKTSSTKVAAGIMNPITGKRLVTLWKTEDDVQFVRDYYKGVEKQLGLPFINKHRLLRFLSRDDELTAYRKRCLDPSYSRYMQAPSDLDEISTHCDVGKVQFECHDVAQMDTGTFLDAAKAYFKEHEAYICTDFKYSDLIVDKQSVQWQGVKAKKCVFCEGARASKNPFFTDLEFENAMGEILEISSTALPKNTILNHGKWLCPIGNTTYKYGTTSYWEDSDKNRQESIALLRKSLSEFLKVPYQEGRVLHGVRPVLKNRQVFSSLHPNEPRLGIITGLGGQGVFLAPGAVTSILDVFSLD